MAERDDKNSVMGWILSSKIHVEILVSSTSGCEYVWNRTFKYVMELQEAIEMGLIHSDNCVTNDIL